MTLNLVTLTSEPEYTLLIKLMDESLKQYYDTSKQVFHDGDMGFDLYSATETQLTNTTYTTFKTGIQAEMLKEYKQYLFDPTNGMKLVSVNSMAENVGYFLMPRSSITNEGLVLGNSVGLIDAGYRGEIMARVYSVTGTENKTYPVGTRLFQLVGPGLVKFKVKLVDSLSETSRGNGGFGSTGK